MSPARQLVLATPGARRRLVGVVAVLVAITAISVGQGLVIARILSRVIAGRSVASVIPALALAAAMQLLRSILIHRRRVLAVDMASEVRAALRHRLGQRLLELGPGRLQATRTGTVQSIFVDGVESLDPYTALFLPQAFAAVIAAVGTTAVIAVIDLRIGLIIGACAAAAPLVPRLSKRLLRSRYLPWWRAYTGLYADNLDAIQGMPTLKALNVSHRRAAELHSQAETFCRYSTRLNSIVLAYVGVVALLVGGGSAAAIALGALHRAAGSLSTTELFTVLLLTRECFRPVRELQDAYHASYGAAPGARAIGELLGSEPARAAVPTRADRQPGAPPALSFDGVSFTYPGRAEPALEGFTLDVAAGETVGIVGRSGAGKTTLMSLLLGFFQPDGGRILLDGGDIVGASLDDVRSRVALVAQDTYLFHGSIRHNIALARPDAGEAEIEAAARAAQADGFITALPGGYDAVVGERGLTLSGGERQRLAIARALLKDAPVLLLDEATSSLDSEAEAEVQLALEHLRAGRTTLVVAHRLATVAGADRVVVMEAGRVVEAGRPGDLVDRRGPYARLVAAQRQGGAIVGDRR